MELLCGLLFAVVIVTVVGHGLWVAAAAVVSAVSDAPDASPAPAADDRPFRDCPGCAAGFGPRDRFCPRCDLDLDGRRASALHRVRVAEREVSALRDAGEGDSPAVGAVLDQLAARARHLRGLTAAPAVPRAQPVAHPVPPADDPPAPSVAEAPATLEGIAEPAPPEPLLPVTATLAERQPVVADPVSPPAEPPLPPTRRAAGFLEAHNILWGELVGGLLIVGCSIALVVTLRQALETVRYFRFLLSAAVTLGLFGAGQYTLHRWKLSGTSRGMLVISLLLTPLTLLLLAAPFTEGTGGLLDVGVKLAALAAFVGVVRTGGRDLIGTEHLPGPVDRRWLLALAVVGATVTQWLPENAAAAWLPLLCFAPATLATLGGLSWYRPGRRNEPIPDKSGSALLLFVGLAAFALLAAWGLYAVRDPAHVAARLAALAVPLALAGVPAVEAGVLVLRRVASGGLRTAGTAVGLAGFGAITTGLALAWPDPLALLLISGLTGAYLTAVAFRERLPWVQVGALGLLSFAVVLSFHGVAGNWAEPAALADHLGSESTGAVLVGFALTLGLIAEALARRGSRQTVGYGVGALVVGAVGLAVASWHGVDAAPIATFTHAAAAAGLLLSNVRWKRRTLAHAGLWVGLVGSLWALWWRVPNRFDVWGFALACEALTLSVGAAVFRSRRGTATALLRRAGRDVAFAAGALAVCFAVASLAPASGWHTGTLFALGAASIALARLTGLPALTWVGSTAALLGALHLAVFRREAGPLTFALEVAILAHATAAALAALVCRRRARVFAEPFFHASRLSTALAVPLLFAPAAGYAFATAGLAVWLAGLWLVFALRWRERGAFPAFQAAVTLAALLAAVGWAEQQEWWSVEGLLDPRALHAFTVALGALGIAWAFARYALRANAHARELWCRDPLSLDRLALGSAVIGFVSLGVLAVLPGASAELTPNAMPPRGAESATLAHVFGLSAYLALGMLAAAVALSWRLTTLERDTDAPAIGLGLLGLAVPVLWAGGFGPELATASALRWGLGTAFVAGSALVALRAPSRRAAEALGFAVRPAPLLRPTLSAVLAVAAGVVLMLSAAVAEQGLNRVAPAGPLASSVFAQMGVRPSNLVPLALVVCGLALTALRDRSAGYALAGGVVFVATLTAGYALGVVTSGHALDGAERTRLALVLAGAAAVWALLWQAVGRRVPGGAPLAVQVSIGVVALAGVCLAPLAHVLAAPGVVLPAAFEPLGEWGWAVLVLVATAGAWHAHRTQPGALSVVPAFAGLIAGVLAAAAVRPWDEPGAWVSFHALSLAWLAVAAGFLATMAHVRLGAWWVLCFSALLVPCALRAGWDDPWRPWLPSGLSLAAAVGFGAVALRTRASVFARLSGTAVTLATLFVWIASAQSPDSPSGFFLATAAGIGLAVAAWTLVRIRLDAIGRGAGWLEQLDHALLPAFLFMLVGLWGTFAGSRVEPPELTLGALAAIAAACAVGLWDRGGALGRPGLFTTGALAVLLVVCENDPRAVWDVPATAPAFGAYAVACAAVTLRRLPLKMPDRVDGWSWPLAAFPALGLIAGAMGLRIGLTTPELRDRLAAPGTAALFAVAFAVPTRLYDGSARESLRTSAVALGAGVLAALAWSLPDPTEAHAWLHRNAWLVVALTAAAVVASEAVTRVGADWLAARRRVAGWAAVGAVAALCVNLVQQVPVFDPLTRRTPLTREASLAMLGAVAGLISLALRFALKPGRDPFDLRPSRKTAYVYLAEVLVVLFFVQIKFNVPELFRRDVAKLWTFAVMLLAYAGIGLAELFERKRLDVLAIPLRRTGVLLPLVPLLAFWAKPPAAVSDFARDTAPGLGPLLSYLEKLPQHFDTYAWLWFLAGGVYGLVALSKRSFGWALLAALATNAAMWSLLAHGEVPFFVHPQAWVIPLALIVLVSEHINRRRLGAEVSNAMRYAGVSMIYVSSAADLFIAGVGESVWLPVVLAVLCVLGVLAGIRLRVGAFIHLGVAFLLLDVFAMIWHAAVNLEQTWVWYASGIVLGVAVLGLFAYLEKRRASDANDPIEGE